MTDTITPALTREEWAEATNDQYYLSDMVEEAADDLAASFPVGPDDKSFAPNTRRHALAALALHGQPFGFTREDVRRLLATAKESDEGDASTDYYLGGYQGTVGSDWLRDLAARIEALLPPLDAPPR